VRLGLTLPWRGEPEAARLAEAAGLFGVLVEPHRPGTEMLAACEVAAATRAVRIVVRVPLGSEHPVTLAEELAVLDNLSGGRVVVLASTADLDLEAAAEDLQLLRDALGARPLRHCGRRWTVPAGIDGHVAPDSVAVTPEPAQIEVPVWLHGGRAHELAALAGVPAMVELPERASGAARVQPAMARLRGDLDADRSLLIAWARAGATHLLLRAEPSLVGEIARFLAPEVAMPGFPRVVSESPLPLPWPSAT
jgi:alkanesulfonate monooxygenase SsuD/methylene tetrahydromethanopterin reductase-like flavin-dependent oxidoreductase (luciferase family)